MSLPPEIAQVPTGLNAQQEAANQTTEAKREMTGFERGTLRWAKLAVGMSAVAAFFVCLQWWEMRRGGIDTHALAQATKNASEAARDQADAAQRFSHTVEAINGRMQDAVDQLESAANNAKAAIKATRDAMRLDQRAWVGIEGHLPVENLRLGGHPRLGVKIVNSGKTPALHFIELIGANEQYTGAPFVADYSRHVPTAPRLSMSVIQPNSGLDAYTLPFNDAFTQAMIDDLKVGRVMLRVYGKLSYEDVFHKRHHTTFCMFVNADLVNLAPCDTYNYAD
ncbi:MAG: hypothetical protein JOY93_10515 [Acidobacteriales bacterium]|nr:hypothetical protein [Terriglobales bacterium]